MNTQSHRTIKLITLVAMFSALAYILALIAHFLPITIVPSVSFLKYDPKDVLICIASFILGPLYGLGISVVVSFLEMITISSTGFYGFVMNVISTCAFIIPATLVYRQKKSFSGALISLAVGFVSALITMTLWNIIITPIYMGVERKLLIEKFLVPIIIFNAVKVGVNVALVLLLYKPLINALRIVKLVDSGKSKFDFHSTLIMLGIGLVLLIILIITWILLRKYM